MEPQQWFEGQAPARAERTGDVIPASDNLYALGSSVFMWKQLYVNTIHAVFDIISNSIQAVAANISSGVQAGSLTVTGASVLKATTARTITPETTATYSLGSVSLWWSNVFSSLVTAVTLAVSGNATVAGTLSMVNALAETPLVLGTYVGHDAFITTPSGVNLTIGDPTSGYTHFRTSNNIYITVDGGKRLITRLSSDTSKDIRLTPGSTDSVVSTNASNMVLTADAAKEVFIGDGTQNVTLRGPLFLSGTSLVPAVTNTLNLGSPTAIWANIYTNSIAPANLSTPGTLSVTGQSYMTGAVNAQGGLAVTGPSSINGILMNGPDRCFLTAGGTVNSYSLTGDIPLTALHQNNGSLLTLTSTGIHNNSGQAMLCSATFQSIMTASNATVITLWMTQYDQYSAVVTTSQGLTFPVSAINNNSLSGTWTFRLNPLDFVAISFSHNATVPYPLYILGELQVTQV